MMKKAELQKIRIQLGQRIRTLRKAQRYSQEKFAEECSLHRTYIGDVERGERNISIDNMAKIAAALKLKIADLF